MSLYSYAAGDLRSSPQHYMYTPFHGAAFLADYLDSRHLLQKSLSINMELVPDNVREALALLLKGVEIVGWESELSALPSPPPPSSEGIERVVQLGEGDTAECAFALMQSPLMECAARSWALDRFRRNFEISRKFSTSYREGLRKGCGELAPHSVYALFSLLFARELLRPDALRYANVTLKVNDTLAASISGDSSPLTHTLFAISITLELQYVRALTPSREAVL